MNRLRRCRMILLLFMLPSLVMPPSTTLAGIFGSHKDQGDGPITLQQAAAYVDLIDKRLFEAGTIGVKAPDVWGQNRMTVHRAEFETQMASRLGSFQLILQAAQNRTDIATLTSANFARGDRRGDPGQEVDPHLVDHPERLQLHGGRQPRRLGHDPLGHRDDRGQPYARLLADAARSRNPPHRPPRLPPIPAIPGFADMAAQLAAISARVATR